jgi:two-component system LytT family sensor kinase
MTDKKWYWICQIGGWSAMVLIEVINYTFFIVGRFNMSLLIWLLVYACIGLLITHLYRYWLKRMDFFRKKRVQIWIMAFLSTLGIAFILALMNILPAWFDDSEASPLRFIDIIGTTINWARYAGVWVIIYFMHQLQQQNNAIVKEKLVLENLAKTTELELLKTQLNPHFLFNALNSIKALVIINPEQSRDAIVKLSELLRFTLQYGRERLIPLQEEINEVKKYLELEQLRYGNRLSLQFDVAENTFSQLLPPAILLTLAENAVKHGINRIPGDGWVSVASRITEDHCIIRISNNGTIDNQPGNGIGLQHVRRRLEEIYHHQAVFSLQQQDEAVTATIQIPVSCL